MENILYIFTPKIRHLLYRIFRHFYSKISLFNFRLVKIVGEVWGKRGLSVSWGRPLYVRDHFRGSLLTKGCWTRLPWAKRTPPLVLATEDSCFETPIPDYNQKSMRPDSSFLASQYITDLFQAYLWGKYGQSILV